MKLADYLKKKKEDQEQTLRPREYCPQCLFVKKNCYCSELRPFDPRIKFVILIHKLEIDRKIATGRLSHLILENSLLLPGHDYSEHSVVNQLLADTRYYPVVLFPGKNSTNLSLLSLEEKKLLVPEGKELLIFIIDGTWATARQTMRLSQNLAKLPRFSFNLNKPSQFRIRKQPKPEFCSTVEAIYETIELLGPSRGFDLESRKHDNLMHVFNFMVEKQLTFYS